MLAATARRIDQALAVCQAVSRGAVWIAGILLISAVFMIGTEIGLRQLFGTPLRGAHEMSGYVLAICTSWAFAWTLFQKAHIRIDLLYARVPLWWQVLLNLFALVLFCFVVVLAVYFAFDVVSTSWLRDSRANTAQQTPLWIPQAIWLLGLAWFALCLLLVTMRTAVGALQGDAITAQLVGGTRRLHEDIRDAREAIVSAPEDRNPPTST